MPEKMKLSEAINQKKEKEQAAATANTAVENGRDTERKCIAFATRQKAGWWTL